MLRKLFIALAPLLAVVAIAVVPAMAYEIEHTYCEQALEPNAGCPPNGSSKYAHMYINEGDAGGQSHETCIDEYETNHGYTGAECMYYAGEEAKETPGGEYGYPRAWNGGTVKHVVDATEYGNK
jgi:hypothetical protein